MSKSRTSDAGTAPITLWLVDGRAVRDDDLAHVENQLGPEEKQRLQRFTRPLRRRQFLLGRALLRYGVAQALDLPIAGIGVIERPALGPKLLLPEGRQAPGFSLSHSRHWVACAIHPHSTLGLDIEVIDPDRDIGELAKLGLYPEEAAWVLDQPGAHRVAAFYRLWTRKEALFKLRSHLGHQEAMPSLIDDQGKLRTDADGWFSRTLPHSELAIALCGNQPLPDVMLPDPSFAIPARLPSMLTRSNG